MCRLGAFLLCMLIPFAATRARSTSTYGGNAHSRSVGAHTRSSRVKCDTCARDANGRIKRDPAQRRAFQHASPCPSTGKTAGACPGYVVDHVVPLKRGGPDNPSNMQWQTIEDAKAKDRVED